MFGGGVQSQIGDGADGSLRSLPNISSFCIAILIPQSSVRLIKYASIRSYYIDTGCIKKEWCKNIVSLFAEVTKE